MGQQLVDPQPDYMSPKFREMDLVGLVAIFPYETLGVEDRGPDFQEGSRGYGRDGQGRTHLVTKTEVPGVALTTLALA